MSLPYELVHSLYGSSMHLPSFSVEAQPCEEKGLIFYPGTERLAAVSSSGRRIPLSITAPDDSALFMAFRLDKDGAIFQTSISVPAKETRFLPYPYEWHGEKVDCQGAKCRINFRSGVWCEACDGERVDIEAIMYSISDSFSQEEISTKGSTSVTVKLATPLSEEEKAKILAEQVEKLKGALASLSSLSGSTAQTLKLLSS